MKLKGIIVSGENGGTHPASVALYKNRPFMTFADTDVGFTWDSKLSSREKPISMWNCILILVVISRIR